ncbi:MAG: site-2 protease family protein [Acidobacteriota bacterium]|nr:site-2 protease family protein [Acidobacteriota bacterium]
MAIRRARSLYVMGGFFQALFAFVVVLAPLVFIHELGHFLVAKAFRIGVPVFSLGFGPRLLGFRRKETDYRLSLIPLGGYVRLSGDESDEHRVGAPEEFLSRPRWQRFLVFVAGATFNIILAFVVFWGYFAFYGKIDVPQVYPQITDVVEGSPAEGAGLELGDTVVSIEGSDVRNAQVFLDHYLMDIKLRPKDEIGMEIERGGVRQSLRLATGLDPEDGSGDPGFGVSWLGGAPAIIELVSPGEPAETAGLLPGDHIVAAGGSEGIGRLELQLLLIKSPDQAVALGVMRDGQRVDIDVTPKFVEGRGGMIGIQFTAIQAARIDLTLGEAASESIATNIALSKTLFVVLKRLVTGRVSTKTLSGPIGIAQVAKDALRAGGETFLYLLGFFSLQLGILNLLPIPVLDGGHILILGVESVMRRDLSDMIKERVMQVGLVFLLLFMGLVIVQDIVKTL